MASPNYIEEIKPEIVMAGTSSQIHNVNTGEPIPKARHPSLYLGMPERLGLIGRLKIHNQDVQGRLGMGTFGRSNIESNGLALLNKVPNIVDAVAGGKHTVVLTHDGRVFTFGYMNAGALGRNIDVLGTEFTPEAVELPNRAIKITTGYSFSACLLECGSVYAWGSFCDARGFIGLTLDGNKDTPFNILPGMKCNDIAAGAHHLVMLTRNGAVYTLGCGDQGQLGRVSLRSMSGRTRHGKALLLKPGKVFIKGAKRIEAIWATKSCTFLRESYSDRIWVFGVHTYRQLAFSPYKRMACTKDMGYIVCPRKFHISDVKQIASGLHHIIVLKNDGTLYTFELDLDTFKNPDIPITQISAIKDKIMTSISGSEVNSFALSDDGQVYMWDLDSNSGTGDDEIKPKLLSREETLDRRIIKVSAGWYHSVMLIADELQPVAFPKYEYTEYKTENEE